MKLSTFIDVFTAALYNEVGLTNKHQFTIGQIIDKYSLEPDNRWLGDIFQDHEFSSRINARRHIGPTRDQRVSLTTDGVRWVEDELGENIASYLEQHGASYQPENLSDPNSGFGAGAFGMGPYGGPSASTPLAVPGQIQPTQSEYGGVDSKRWTGTQFVLVDGAVLAEVRLQVGQLHRAIHAMHFPSNSESQNIKGLADALLAICSMAEPELTLLDRILASPKFQVYAVLIAAVASIRGAIGF